jgi:cation transporter-like permease
VIKENRPESARKKIVTAAIIAVLAAPALYLLGLWAVVAEWLGTVWAFLAESTLVPNWLLAFLTICAFIVAGILGTALRPDRESADPDKGEPPDQAS